MRTKLFIIFPAIALALAACTQDATFRPNPAPPGTTNGSVPPDVLLLGTENGPVAVSVATGSVLFEGIGAVASPDGSRLYSASSDGLYTLLETLDPATGSVLSSTRIGGDLDVRAVSGSGRAVALMEPLPEGVDQWTPVPRSHTTIVVADPTGADEPRRYHLEGNFEPEAFSTSDSQLFLIQYLPAEAPAVYRVTVLELADGDVHAVFGPFKSPPERMPGTRLRQALAPSGKQLYTLYTSQPPAYAEGFGSAGGEPVSFIHVLDLEQGWAHCVGLPEELWGQPASAQAMAASPDGERLYVVDSIRGLVAVMDTSTLEIFRTEELQLESLGGIRTSAQVSADGDTLFVGSVGDGSAVYAIDSATLDVLHRWPLDGIVSGLGLSGDGLRLYVALGDRVAVLDPATGQELAAVPFFG
ncbi:MAG: YncE family protein, partial [Actinomycetota bacterium]